jgi:hypothetical protein
MIRVNHKKCNMLGSNFVLYSPHVTEANASTGFKIISIALFYYTPHSPVSAVRSHLEA